MKIKNSYDFEVVCKNALIKELADKYNEDLSIEDLHLVWFTKALKVYKCVIIDLGDNQRYYECTYNIDKNELYVDIYEKQYNIVYTEDEMDNEAKPKDVE